MYTRISIPFTRDHLAESGLRSKWTISIHQAEVKCEIVLVDVQGRKTSVREGEIRTIVFKKLPACLGPVMSIFLTNLVENKSRYGGGPVERVQYDHGLKLAVVLLRQFEGKSYCSCHCIPLYDV